MKAAAIRNATEVETVARNGESARRRLYDFAELVKARLTLLVLLATAAGFYLGAQSPINYAALFHVVFGTAAAAAGAAALNQWWERKLDALMRRTRTRPVPAGRMRPVEALTLGVVLSIFGVGYLVVACNALSATLAALTIFIYIFLWLHPAEAGQHRKHTRRRNSRRDSADDRLGGGARNNRGWCMEPLCDPSVVATAAFLRDRLDVPR